VSTFRGRPRHLERETEGERMTLRCSECGEEFTAYGEVALECIAYGWSRARATVGPKLLVSISLPQQHTVGVLA
jgi:hypothetical protein